MSLKSFGRGSWGLRIFSVMVLGAGLLPIEVRSDSVGVRYEQDRERAPGNDAFTVLRLGQINADLHLAQSGAFWRLKLQGLGDVIGSQKPDSTYIDRVFQSVATNKDLKNSIEDKTKDKWFLHQAGAYQRHGRTKVLYSPQIFHWYRPQSQTIDFVNLPQQAHDPTNTPQPAAFNHQRIEVIDARTIRMAYRWSHQSPGYPVLDHFNFPWLALNKDKLGHLFVLDPSGTRMERQEIGIWNDTLYTDATMGNDKLSAIGFYSSPKADEGNGITLVFPKSGNDYLYRVGQTPDGKDMVLSRIPNHVVLRPWQTIDSGDLYVVFGNRSVAESTLAGLAARVSATVKVTAQPFVYLVSARDAKAGKTMYSTMPFFGVKGEELLRSNLDDIKLVAGSQSMKCHNSKRLDALAKHPLRVVRKQDRSWCRTSPYGLIDLR
jgi:hypothetical protein